MERDGGVGGGLCKVRIIGGLDSWPGSFPYMKEEIVDKYGKPKQITMSAVTAREMLDAGVKLDFWVAGAVDYRERVRNLRT